MRKIILAAAMIVGWTAAVWAAAPGPLTTLRAIHALSNAEAARQPAVDFEATVTCYRTATWYLFVQDGDAAIFILLTKSKGLAAGDRIRIRGMMEPSFHPIVASDDVTVIGHSDLPIPMRPSYDDLVRARYDAMRVTVHGVIRSANLIYTNHVRSILLHMLVDDAAIDVAMEGDDRRGLKDLLDADAEVTGVAAGKFDSKMQQTGFVVHANTIADIKVLRRAGMNPWDLPVTPMDRTLGEYRVRDLTARVRVHGTITYYQPGVAVVLQDGRKSIWIATETDVPLQIGDIADASGFPDFRNGFLNLLDGEIQDSRISAPIAPPPANWQSLSVSDNVQYGHIYDLVSIEGQIVTSAREAERDEYVVNSKGRLFTAIYFHSDKTSLIPLPEMKQIPVSTTVRVSGICIEISSNQRNGPVPFDILLRNFDDIEVIARPSWLNVRNLTTAVGLLLALFFALGTRSWLVERKVRRQAAASAALERRRSRILEDTNGTESLTRILEQIVEMVSFMLGGAPCWCEISDGARLGNCPQDLSALRIVQEEIPARTGPPIGAIFLALDPHLNPSASESEALSMGVGLATLALESRRMYSDLRHRSEFDLLTDIHNRFSLEKHLDAQIEIALEQGVIFGLIYIDLDEFKQVNDLYGHLFGDLYLQEVTRRMTQQLRSHDLLARLAGDEFAALLPVVRSRADVDEIALRLERSFDAPINLEGHILHGSASFGIALYPEDGATRESILSAADAAMYRVKYAHRQTAEILTVTKDGARQSKCEK